MPDCKVGWETYPRQDLWWAGALSISAINIGMSSDKRLNAMQLEQIDWSV